MEGSRQEEGKREEEELREARGSADRVGAGKQQRMQLQLLTKRDVNV